MTMQDTDAADALCAFVDASPSPFHAVAATAAALDAAGFTRVDSGESWPAAVASGRGYVVRDGSLVAWNGAFADGPTTAYRVVGAHTDSPNLRIKPRPDLTTAGWDQLAVEVYGGPLLNSWLDRDLGLSGRVMVRGAGRGGVEEVLVRVDEPLLRVPQLAIHLDRSAPSEGLTLNPQTQLTPVWGATGAAPSFTDYLAGVAGCAAEDLLGWDIMTHDLTPSRRIGLNGDLLAAPRLDNLASSHAGLQALCAAADGPAPEQPVVQVLVLFDHEEIGSTTERGAFSTLLPGVLERLVLARGGSREDLLRALSRTVIASADMAHAVHPNYPERHDPQHLPLVGGGPVLKVNAKGRYATDARGTAAVRLAAERVGVPLQVFVSRGDMPCGSTIGPMVAATTGATTVDLGAPMVSMHSARELCGTADVVAYPAVLRTFLTWA